MEVLQGVREISADAVRDLKSFFQTPAADGDEKGQFKRAELAVKVLGRLNGMESTRLKGLALGFQVAKSVGVRGDQLKPLLAEILPPVASGELPEKTA